MLSTIDDILDFSRAESSYLQLNETSFQLEKVLTNLEEMFAISTNEKELNFSILYKNPIEKELIGDPQRLTQVLVNLLANAVKYTEQGEVTLSIESKQSDANSHVNLHFKIIDTGIGIAKEYLDKLFVPFFQTDEGISRKYGGFGLGLSISNHLIKQMGGEIQVTSEINKGSCFFFTLKFPTQESTPSNTDTLSIENDRKTHKQSTCLATSFGGIQVLLVDDDEINRFIGSKALKKLGIPCSGWQWRKCHPSTTSTSY